MALRISSFPVRSSNPYLDLFYNALAPHGVERVEEFLFSPRWLLAKHGEVDAIHFHWSEWLWNGMGEGRARTLLKLYMMLKAAKAIGIKLIWTVHNEEPHEGNGWQDRVGQRLLARHVDLIITHSENAAESVRMRLRPRGTLVVMPHGSYEGHYPSPRPREDVLAGLGLDDRPVLCCTGWLRDYKGVDIACEAVGRLGGAVQLVVAGAPHRAFDMNPIEQYAKSFPEIILIPRALSDQEFVDILSISEAALLPYRRITGSGVLLAAWTAGCGVIASDLGFFRELLPESSDAGMLFRSGSAASLARAVRTYLTIAPERRKQAALALAKEYEWDRCVVPVAEAIRGWEE